MGRMRFPVLAYLWICICFVALNGYATSLPVRPLLSHLVTSKEFTSLKTVGDMNNIKEHILSKANILIAKSFSEHIRRRRNASNLPSTVINGTSALNFALDDKLAGLMKKSSSHKIIADGNKTYMVLCTARNDASLVLGVDFPNLKLDIVSEFYVSPSSEDKIDKIVGALFGGRLWLALGSSSSRLVSIIRVDLGSGSSIFAHNIPVQGSLQCLHMFQTADNLYLVIGAVQHESSPIGNSGLYILLKDYFDYLEDLPFKTSNVKDITGFADGVNYYLVFAVKSSGRSQVYHFDPTMHTLKLLQELPDEGIQRIVHFSDLHDQKHYVITLQSKKPPKLYWWEREQLFEWQTLITDPSFQGNFVGVLPLDNLETMIFISDQKNILLYLDDQTAHYHPEFTIATNCSKVVDPHGSLLGSNVVVSYICLSDTGLSTGFKAHVLHLEQSTVKREKTSLQNSLDELSSKLEARKEEVAELERLSALLMTVDGPQNWTGPVTFSRGLKVTGTTKFATSLTLLDQDATYEEFSRLSLKANTLREMVKNTSQAAENVIFKERDQNITGSISVGNITVDRAELELVRVNQVFGVPLNKFHKEFLMNGYNQTIDYSVRVGDLVVHTLTTHSTPIPAKLNGILAKDLMRKSNGDQVVTGNLSFNIITCKGIINNKDPLLPVTINGQTTANILIRGSNVSFTNHVTLDSLKVEEGPVYVDFVKNVHLKTFAEEAVYRDTDKMQVLHGNYTVGSLRVLGNLDVKFINSINLTELDLNVLKKTGDFVLEGPLAHSKTLIISGNLTTNFINYVKWDDIIDLDSPGILLGKYHIKELEVSKEIICNCINEVDLSEEAVLNDRNQRIFGHIAFANDVMVKGEEGVLMAEGATINGIDLSELLEATTNQTGTLVIEGDSKLNISLSISDNVTARSINNIPLNGIKNLFWQRSVHQNITVPIYMDTVVFNDAVTGDTINGHKISDYINIDRPQVLTGHFTYKGPVTVEGDLNMKRGHTVDGVDVSELAKNVVTLHDQQVIHGHAEFENVSVEGDLEVDRTLNKLRIPEDLMMLNHPQVLNGTYIFNGHTVATSVDVSGDNLSVLTLNGLNISKVTQNFILRDQDAIITSPLQFFNNLYADNLHVTGRIDGEDFNEILETALKKSSNTTQYVTGSVSLNGSLLLEGNTLLGEVNGKDWTSHLNNVVLRNFSGRLQGIKTFVRPINITSNFSPDIINNISVNGLEHSLLKKSGSQEVFGYYTFNGNLNGTTVWCPDVNGINVSELMLVDQPQQYVISVIFTNNVTFVAGIVTGTEILNDCNVTELEVMSHAVDVTKLREFHTSLAIQALDITGNISVNNEMLLGTQTALKLKPFFKNLVLKSSDQEISGKVTFMQDPRIESLHAEFINGVEIKTLLEESIRDDDNITLQCNLNFTKSLRIKDLAVLDAFRSIDSKGLLINNISISKLFNKAANLVSGSLLVSGNINFTNGFSAANLLVNGSINGVDVTDLVTLSDNVKVDSNITFSSPIYISKNLKVSGLIDGIDVDKVLKNRITLQKLQTVNGSYVFGSIVVEGDLVVAAVNDVQIADLVVRYGQPVQKITGLKTFRNFIVNGNIESSSVNGIDFQLVNKTVVRRDEDASLYSIVTFVKEVYATSLVNHEKMAKQIGLDDQIEHMNSTRTKVADQWNNFKNALSEVQILNEENYLDARNMFSKLAYIEKTSFQSTDKFGKLQYVQRPDLGANSSLLSIQSCVPDCLCQAVTTIHQVYSGGSIETLPFEEISGSRYILSSPSSNLLITMDVECDTKSTATATVLVWQQQGNSSHLILKEEKSLGLVVDAKLFVDKDITYIVAVAVLQNVGDPGERNNITAMRVDIKIQQLVTVWFESTQSSASSVDLIFIGDHWHLLVANHHQASNLTDPFTAVSQLFVWKSTTQEFTLKGKFKADHVTSGIFLKSVWPVEEFFFSLSQLKAAEYSVYEENVHYTREVMIYRYSNTRSVFEVFELLPAYGVVDQVTFTINNNLYLALLSEVKEALYIYEYVPLEGFRLYQEITVEAAHSLEVINLPLGGMMLVVSAKSLAGLYTLSVIIKGVSLP